MHNWTCLRLGFAVLWAAMGTCVFAFADDPPGSPEAMAVDTPSEPKSLTIPHGEAVRDDPDRKTIRRMRGLLDSPSPIWQHDRDESSYISSPAPTPEDASHVLEHMRASANPEVRSIAVEALGEQSGERLQTLLASLFDPDPAVRDSAIQGIRQTDPRSMQEAILAVYSESDYMYLAGAVDLVLPSLRAVLEEPMLELLQSEAAHPYHRAIAAYSLGRMGSARAMPYCAQLTWSSDYNLALRSAEALARIADPGQTKHFVQLTSHPYDAVRWLAAQGLGRIGSSEAINTLQIVARSPYETNQSVRTEAIRWLGVQEDDSSISVLISVLREPHQLVRQAAGEALRQLTGMSYGDTFREWNEWYRSMERRDEAEASPEPMRPSLTMPAVPPGWTPGSGHDLEEQLLQQRQRAPMRQQPPPGLPTNMQMPGSMQRTPQRSTGRPPQASQSLPRNMQGPRGITSGRSQQSPGQAAPRAQRPEQSAGEMMQLPEDLPAPLQQPSDQTGAASIQQPSGNMQIREAPPAPVQQPSGQRDSPMPRPQGLPSNMRIPGGRPPAASQPPSVQSGSSAQAPQGLPPNMRAQGSVSDDP